MHRHYVITEMKRGKLQSLRNDKDVDIGGSGRGQGTCRELRKKKQIKLAWHKVSRPARGRRPGGHHTKKLGLGVNWPIGLTRIDT